MTKFLSLARAALLRRAALARSSERVSTLVLWVLLGLTAVVFGAFWTVGYDRPFDAEPDFTAPLLTDTLLVFCALLMAAALAAVGVSLWRSLRRYSRAKGTENKIPARRIALITAAATACALALGFALGGTEAVSVNGVPYTDTVWLRTADMFISVAALLLAVAAAAVACGYAVSWRRAHRGA